MKEPLGKNINVSGIDVELELRTCEGGCNRTFYTMKDSKNKTFFSDCFYRCEKKKFSDEDKKLLFNQQYQMKKVNRRKNADNRPKRTSDKT